MKKPLSLPLVDVLLFLVVIIWASNFTIIKHALQEIPPMGFNTLRFILSSIVLGIYFHFFIGNYKFIRENWKMLVMTAIIGNGIMQITFINGVNFTSAGNSSLIYSTVPIFIALLSVGFKHEKVTKFTWIGIVISFIGIIVVLSGSKAGISFSNKTLVGDLLILFTAFCWSLYSVLAKPLIEKSSMMTVISATFFFGTLFLIPFGMPDLLSMDWGAISMVSWAELGYSFLFANIIAYVLWFYGVTKVGNVQTAIFQNMIPILAVIIAVVFLKEEVTIYQIVGGGGIIGGISLTRMTAVFNKKMNGNQI